MTGATRERLGPFRLEGQLGHGGMGDVFVAYDERLDRRVAIKVVRPEAAGDGVARQRLHREARAAAALSHPAIVQIYDILAVPGTSHDGAATETDAIVMELVTGETLSQRLQRGPCSLEMTLRLGAEIAGGLAAAHQRGIVHRDLKAENVMIDDAGHAKILDFGVARRPQAAGDPALTIKGLVLGTARAMSPEQARGLALDGRSDLFALGVLLYEMVTGESPFLAATTVDTLARVCSAAQRPAHDLRPDLPPALVALIDRLLEKDPGRRPQSAGEVERLLLGGGGSAAGAATAEQATWQMAPLAAPPHGSPVRDVAAVTGAGRPSSAFDRWHLGRHGGRRLALGLAAAVALGAAAWLGLRQRAGAPIYVAVPLPQVGAGRGLDGVELLPAAVRGALLRSLLSLDGVRPLAVGQVDPVGGSPAAVTRATAADELVSAHLDCTPASCQIALSRILGRDGTLLWTANFEAPMGRPYLLAEAVTVHLRDGYASRAQHYDVSPLEVSPDDYAEFLRLRDELERRRLGLPLDALIERAGQLRRRAPRFLEAAMLEADLLRLRFGSHRDAADLARADSALQDAARLAPNDPRPLFGMFEVALRGERLADAGRIVARLERLLPGDADVEVVRAKLLERRGDHDQALAEMREAVRLRPSWRSLYEAANLEQQQGEYAAARRHLQDLLARYPGYSYARSMLAQVELLSGSPERAAALYASLVQEAPRLGDVVNLGLADMLLARYPQAEERLRQAWSLEPANPLFGLNLADTLLLEKRPAEAAAVYRRVVELAAHDPAAAGWQLLSCRAQALAHLGRRAQAAAAAQRVLILAQGNAQANFEVALVYCLVGDDASALVNAEAALQQGYAPVWFGLPWFDRLRATPELAALITARQQAAAQPPAAASTAGGARQAR
jgi:serine/threonine-protein kinase